MPAQEPQNHAATLAGLRVRLIGRFASMPQNEAGAAVCRRGGVLVEERPDLVCLGEDSSAEQRELAHRAAEESGVELLSEGDLWRRLGLLDDGSAVQSLYTPAMLAEVVGAPLAAIRRWRRRGALQPVLRIKRLPYFDYAEAKVAQTLAELLDAGRTLAAVDRMIDRLESAYEALERPLAELPVTVEDGALCIRENGSLTEPTGQKRFDFQSSDDSPQEESPEEDAVILPISLPDPSASDGAGEDALRIQAEDLRDQGELDRAIESWRLIMLSASPTADDHFTLAEWLYESGDAAGARERYYAALELDEAYLEARVNLGCLLWEAGEQELSIAAFHGALETHEGFADAHYHLARLLDERGEPSEAERHWVRFLEIAPEGPWSEEANRRLGREG